MLLNLTSSHFENGRDVTAYFMLGLKRRGCSQVAGKYVGDYKKGTVETLACL